MGLLVSWVGVGVRAVRAEGFPSKQGHRARESSGGGGEHRGPHLRFPGDRGASSVPVLCALDPCLAVYRCLTLESRGVVGVLYRIRMLG